MLLLYSVLIVPLPLPSEVPFSPSPRIIYPMIFLIVRVMPVRTGGDSAEALFVSSDSPCIFVACPSDVVSSLFSSSFAVSCSGSLAEVFSGTVTVGSGAMEGKTTHFPLLHTLMSPEQSCLALHSFPRNSSVSFRICSLAFCKHEALVFLHTLSWQISIVTSPAMHC